MSVIRDSTPFQFEIIFDKDIHDLQERIKIMQERLLQNQYQDQYISFAQLKDPVSCQCIQKHIFERDQILKWLDKNQTCPQARCPLFKNMLQDENGLKLEIEDILNNIQSAKQTIECIKSAQSQRDETSKIANRVFQPKQLEIELSSNDNIDNNFEHLKENIKMYFQKIKVLQSSWLITFNVGQTNLVTNCQQALNRLYFSFDRNSLNAEQKETLQSLFSSQDREFELQKRKQTERQKNIPIQQSDINYKTIKSFKSFNGQIIKRLSLWNRIVSFFRERLCCSCCSHSVQKQTTITHQNYEELENQTCDADAAESHHQSRVGLFISELEVRCTQSQSQERLRSDNINNSNLQNHQQINDWVKQHQEYFKQLSAKMQNQLDNVEMVQQFVEETYNLEGVYQSRSDKHLLSSIEILLQNINQFAFSHEGPLIKTLNSMLQINIPREIQTHYVQSKIIESHYKNRLDSNSVLRTNSGEKQK